MEPNQAVDTQASCVGDEAQSMEHDQNPEVDRDAPEVEPLQRRLEIPEGNTIVACESPDVDCDWSSYFQTAIVFDSPESVKKWLMEKAREVHMTIVVKRSDFSKGRSPRIFYACERSGAYKKARLSQTGLVRKTGTKSGQVKKTGTKKCECPFKIKTTNQSNDGDHWVVKVICGRHNHALTPYIQGHACHAKLTPREKEFFIDLSKGGVKPKAALSIMRERNPKSSISLQTLYNVKKKVTKREIEDRTGHQQMMMLGDQQDYIMPDSGVSSASTPSFGFGTNTSVACTSFSSLASSTHLSSLPSLFGASSTSTLSSSTTASAPAPSFSSSTTSFSFNSGSAPTRTTTSAPAPASCSSATTSSSAGSFSFGTLPSSLFRSSSFETPASTTASITPVTNPRFGSLFTPSMSTTSNISFSGPAASTATTTPSIPSLSTSQASASAVSNPSAPAFGGTSFPSTTSLTSAANSTTPASAAATTSSLPSFSLSAKATAPASQSSTLPQTSTAKTSFDSFKDHNYTAGVSAGDADPSTSFSYLGSGSRLMHHVSQVVEECREFALHHFKDTDRLQRVVEEQRHEISALRQERDFMIVERAELQRNLESARNDLQFKEAGTHLEHEKLIQDLEASEDARRAAEAALEAQQRRNASSDMILGRMTTDYQFQRDRYRELYQYCMEAGIELLPHFSALTP